MNNSILVEFKSNRKEYFDNKDRLEIKKNDYVLVQAEIGMDLGKVHLTSEQIPDEFLEDKELKSVVRLAVADDIVKLNENRIEEEKAKETVRQKIVKYALKMKLVDAEYQYDRKRLVFFFTAEKRVDFRSLVRDLAGEFKTRIELRQIGVRDESKRVDGFGPCGWRMCCSNHLTEFNPITTDCAKDQCLQLNPSKLTGICGRLKCCLSYERDYYVSTLTKLPKIGYPVTTAKGPGTINAIDIIGNKIQIQHGQDGDMEVLNFEEASKYLNIDL
jgi:cell fate regulator YaaT (PSP1 superfamily)